MVSGINGNIQETGNKAESQKHIVPLYLIGMPISQEVKGDRHKNKGLAMPTIKSTFPSYVVYRIHGKTWYAPRWDRAL